MLNNLASKQPAKRDLDLIGGSKPVVAKPINKLESTENKPHANKTSSAFANNAKKVMGLEIDKFKQWTGHNDESQGSGKVIQKYTTPNNLHKSSMSSGFAFNNDRYSIGNNNQKQFSSIVKKEDYNPMIVKDIDGASSKIKSHILNKIYEKKSSVERFLKSSSTLDNGMRYEPSERGNERAFDTKRFMRVDDIPGAQPKDTHSVTDKEKYMILSNDPTIDEIYHNSHYYRKQRERQGKLPFTRRINKGTNLHDKSHLSTINPYTGEDINNPYLNISLGQPNERMKRNLEKLDYDNEGNKIYTPIEIIFTCSQPPN